MQGLDQFYKLNKINGLNVVIWDLIALCRAAILPPGKICRADSSPHRSAKGGHHTCIGAPARA
jgi:hypothetical protein